MKTYQTLLLEALDTHVLLVTLNRPERYNAINSEMMIELRELWQSVYVDAFPYHAIILTGAAPAFCAGADLKERNKISLDLWRQHHAIFEQAMLAMLDCPIPILAAVNGAAYGGGLELAMACDFAYAATNATFAQSEVKVGLIPAALGTQHLPRAAGLRRAKELIYTARSFSAEEAHRYGILNQVCDPESLIEEVMMTAKLISENAPLAVKEAKKCLNMSQQLDIKSGFSYELEAYNRILPTEDRKEGIRAFNEKRKPQFVGK